MQRKKIQPLVWGTVLALSTSFYLPGKVWAEETVPKEVQAEKAPSGDIPVTEVEVKDKKDRQDSAKEGSAASGYRVCTGQLGPLGNISLQDTPFSIHVTSGELIENRGAHSESDALKTNPTVASLMEPNTYSSLSRVMIRGFTAADQSDLRDGMTDRSFTYPPLENVERIEVQNGLSSFLYGFSAVGGSVNYISKQPTSTPLASVATGVYGGGIGYIHADLGGPADSEKRLTYRLNAYKEDGDTYIDGGKQNRSLLSGVLNYQASPNTVLKADWWHQNYSLRGLQTYLPLVNGGAVPSADRFDATKQYGQPWTFDESEKTLMGVGVESKLTNVFTFRAAYRYGDMWRRYNIVSALNLDNSGNYQERYTYTPTQYETTHSAYALMDASFNTANIHHDVTFGYSGTRFWYSRGNDIPGLASAGYLLGNSSLDSPAYFTIPQIGYDVRQNPSATIQSNLVIGDRITFNPSWSALVGVNKARYQYKLWDVTTGDIKSEYTQSKTTPSMALIYKPTPAVSTYVSYMEGLAAGGTAPQTYTYKGVIQSVANKGEMLAPSVSKQWETGVKTTFGATDVTAALFKIDKVNEYTDPSDSVYKQDGRQVHQGVEVTASGKLTDRLTLIGGFTLMNAEYTKAANNPSLEGKIPVNVPEQQARAYLEYVLPKAPGVTVSAGINYYGKRPVDSANTAYLAGATTYDAGVRYQTTLGGYKTTYALTVSNLFNKAYWSYYRDGDGLLLGAPRVVSLSAKVEF